eukprot:TRINITY_DN122041_c0_g1_i1.p1 TRINITY_DN122041_c0_g1~~TRINITY_DN122041_c0_g1_i1.p1  ORF type:complete len:393 (-),score=80.68 TRINITY_DN122041_c0_g1_i1:180-1358(-)
MQHVRLSFCVLGRLCIFSGPLLATALTPAEHSAAGADLAPGQRQSQRVLLRAEAVGRDFDGGRSDAAVEDSAAQMASSRDGREADGSPPALGRFRADFEELHSKEAAAAKPSDGQPGSVKLLIGVLTRGFEQDYRHVHRNTWMTAPGACAVDIKHDVQPPNEKDCRYYVTFVMGHNEKNNHSVELEAAEHGDVTPLWFSDRGLAMGDASPVVLHRDNTYHLLDQLSADDKEFDWRRGIKLKKSMWLRFASLHFRWATHIASADLDTFPHVNMILSDLRDPSQSRWADKRVRPSGWSESNGGVYYGASCAGAMGFKQGAFTCISRGFLECMFQNPQLNGKLDLYLGAPGGDVIVARLVTVATKAPNNPAGTCASPWWVGPADCSWDSRWAHPV